MLKMKKWETCFKKPSLIIWGLQSRQNKTSSNLVKIKFHYFHITSICAAILMSYKENLHLRELHESGKSKMTNLPFCACV